MTVERWGKDDSANPNRLWAVTRPGTDVHNVATEFRDIIPGEASTRTLQAASNPDRYNLREYPGHKQMASQIRYETEEITMAEALDDYQLEGKVTSDDEFDFDDDDVLFIRHNWFVPVDIAPEESRHY